MKASSKWNYFDVHTSKFRLMWHQQGHPAKVESHAPIKTCPQVKLGLTFLCLWCYFWCGQLADLLRATSFANFTCIILPSYWQHPAHKILHAWLPRSRPLSLASFLAHHQSSLGSFLRLLLIMSVNTYVLSQDDFLGASWDCWVAEQCCFS